jgi:hypothetical protein
MKPAVSSAEVIRQMMASHAKSVQHSKSLPRRYGTTSGFYQPEDTCWQGDEFGTADDFGIGYMFYMDAGKNTLWRRRGSTIETYGRMGQWVRAEGMALHTLEKMAQIVSNGEAVEYGLKMKRAR